MFGSAVLDVGIGITLLFLFVSLICSAMREAAETVLKSRAMDLERGIREILNDRNGNQIADKIYDHPFIYSLFSGTYKPTQLVPGKYIPGLAGQKIMPRKARSHLPTYIPSKAFAAALIDVVAKLADPAAPLSVAALRDGIGKIPDENVKLKKALLAMLDQGDDDLAAVRKAVESWYDATMDRVSGWYKRRTQFILLAIGLLTAVAFNIDAINAARHLATDKAYRDAVVAQAAAVQERGEGAALSVGDGTLTSSFDQVDAVRTELGEAGFIMGWPAAQWTNCGSARGRTPCWLAVPQMMLGWVVTALAVSLGAPFWFDVLNKFMVIRSTVKPAEKSGAEGSKDSAPDKAKGSADATLSVVVRQAPAEPTAPATVKPGRAMKSRGALPPQTGATGNPDDGCAP